MAPPATDRQPQATDEQPARRRRLETGERERVEGRSGCLAMGAVLGVIAGIMVGLYALPPILRSMYGEEQVGVGDAYRGSGMHLRVLSVETLPAAAGPGNSVLVTLSVISDDPWEPQAGEWRLQLAGGERLEGALSRSPGEPPVFQPGEPGRLMLLFPLLPGLESRPVYLHLANPRVRFDLPGPRP